MSLTLKTIQFTIYHLLIVVVDHITRLPRSGVQPEVERILRENLALKAQVRALVLELKSERSTRPKVSMRTRAAQVFAYLLTRGDKAFQNCYLSTSRRALAKWATTFRRGPWPWRRPRQTGRPPPSQTIKDLIIRLKSENPIWGACRIKDELRRMGIKVSDPTIQKVLKEAGFNPRGGHPFNLERFRRIGNSIADRASFDKYLVRSKPASMSALAPRALQGAQQATQCRFSDLVRRTGACGLSGGERRAET